MNVFGPRSQLTADYSEHVRIRDHRTVAYVVRRSERMPWPVPLLQISPSFRLEAC